MQDLQNGFPMVCLHSSSTWISCSNFCTWQSDCSNPSQVPDDCFADVHPIMSAVPLISLPLFFCWLVDVCEWSTFFRSLLPGTLDLRIWWLITGIIWFYHMFPCNAYYFPITTALHSLKSWRSKTAKTVTLHGHKERWYIYIYTQSYLIVIYAYIFMFFRWDIISCVFLLKKYIQMYIYIYR